MSKKKSDSADKVTEPGFPYKKIIRSSLEEQEELNRQYSMSLSPSERLAYLLKLNINAYGRQSLEVKSFGIKIFLD